MNDRHLHLPRPQRLGARVLLACWAWGAALSAHAVTVQCHLGFAGAQRTVVIAPQHHAGNEVLPQIQGASLALQVLNRLPPEPGAGVQINTFAMGLQQPFLLHQATFNAQATHGAHGFTGLQVVREPVRGHEIAYWCERLPR